MPENIQAYQVYARCSDDWVMSGGMESHRITISGPAIETAIRMTGGIKDKRKRLLIYDQVKMLGRAVAKEIQQELANRPKEGTAGQ